MRDRDLGDEDDYDGMPEPVRLIELSREPSRADAMIDLLIAQLRDANYTILALQAELAEEKAKTAAIARAAARTVYIPDVVAVEDFPIRAISYSWGTK